jgi:7-cyano-7-deazaguanine synthase in queuosine biosynthesis
MSKEKRPLVLWSGGFDSTCLVIDKLHDGDIDILYIDLENNWIMQRQERRAICKMKALIKDANLKGQIINSFNFRYGMIPVTKSVYAQPALWLQAASMIADAEHHSEVNIAYVRHDDAWHYKTEIMNAYTALNQLTSPDNIVPVKFPFEWFTKTTLLEQLKTFEYHKPLLNLIYYCEAGTKKPCGECSSCKRHDDELKGADHTMAIDMTGKIQEVSYNE